MYEFPNEDCGAYAVVKAYQLWRQRKHAADLPTPPVCQKEETLLLHSIFNTAQCRDLSLCFLGVHSQSAGCLLPLLAYC